MADLARMSSVRLAADNPDFLPRPAAQAACGPGLIAMAIAERED